MLSKIKKTWWRDSLVQYILFEKVSSSSMFGICLRTIFSVYVRWVSWKKLFVRQRVVSLFLALSWPWNYWVSWKFWIRTLRSLMQAKKKHQPLKIVTWLNFKALTKSTLKCRNCPLERKFIWRPAKKMPEFKIHINWIKIAEFFYKWFQRILDTLKRRKVFFIVKNLVDTHWCQIENDINKWNVWWAFIPLTQ